MILFCCPRSYWLMIQYVVAFSPSMGSEYFYSGWLWLIIQYVVASPPSMGSEYFYSGWLWLIKQYVVAFPPSMGSEYFYSVWLWPIFPFYTTFMTLLLAFLPGCMYFLTRGEAGPPQSISRRIFFSHDF